MAELLLAQTYNIASRIHQAGSIEAANMIEGISEALLLAMHFNEAAGYEWTPRVIRLEHMRQPQNVPCDEVASYWVRFVLTEYLTKGEPEAMYMAAKYTVLLSRYKLLSINKQAWACSAFVALMRIMQSSYGVVGRSCGREGLTRRPEGRRGAAGGGAAEHPEGAVLPEGRLGHRASVRTVRRTHDARFDPDQLGPDGDPQGAVPCPYGVRVLSSHLHGPRRRGEAGEGEA